MSAMPRTAVCNAPCNERGGPRYDMDDGAANSAIHQWASFFGRPGAVLGIHSFFKGMIVVDLG